jgi:phenylalanyl-tRNA synthetase beta chain
VKVLLSWVREFVDVPGTAEEIGRRMSMRGLSLEGIEAIGDDAVLDFEVTANRPDCLSIRGIAREIATAYERSLKAPAEGHPSAPVARGTQTGEDTDTIPVTIDDPDLCARYVAAVADVKIGPSPAWMQSRLHACGVRPINNVVDVTNYVLLELGHPMHAFDYARLAGPAIVVRCARSGERITTLDGKTRGLAPDMLAIADAERPAAIGGVMGGADSEVSEKTRRIVLESAWFEPRSIRSTSKRLGLRTEASYRFERGADLEAPAVAMARALELIEQIGAGHPACALVDRYPRPYKPRQLPLDAPSIPALLGMEVPESEVTRILESLGFAVARQPQESPTTWRVSVPSWRVDIHRRVDLIEEVGRHHGFEHLPATFPGVQQAPLPSDPRVARDRNVRRMLLAMGFSEAITFGFIESAAAAPYLEGQTALDIANPLSEKFATLRPSLIPGLVDAVSHNRRHGRRDVRVFEIGTRFAPSGETRGAALAWTGLSTPEHWSGGQRNVDFFDVKGVAEKLCEAMHTPVTVAPGTRGYLVDGRTAEARINGNVVAVMGQLRPDIAERRDLPAADEIYVAEFNLDRLAAAVSTEPWFAKPLPRHPSVVRDLAILIDDTLSAETVRGTIRRAAPPILVDVREFDRYQGKGIAEGKVSLALRLTFRAPDRTLTDAEVHAAMQSIVSTLMRELSATQR